MSAIVELIIEDFLPEMHSKYMFQNYAMSSDYRSYNEFVPHYLRGRPRKVIFHCLERKQKSRTFSADDITTVNATNGVYEVKSHSGKLHMVDFGKQSMQPSCSCKDWTRHHIPCKHFFTVFCYIPSWQWDSLPTSYLQSEYLSQDSMALDVIQETNSHSPSSDEPENVQSTSDNPDFIPPAELPKHQVYVY